MSEPTRCEIDVEVRYIETDKMGVVHHANYIAWFELARTKLCAMSGYHYAEIEAMGYLLMVTGVEVRYRRPFLYGDVARVVCWGERLMSRGVRFAYEVLKEGEVRVSGATEHIWVEAVTGRPCRPPEAVQEQFRRLAGQV
ncbi:MAG TPA: thioesterase family protein [Thermoanaerobaculia bacterium]|nr:thioesterase family protein [Thermoanaerobaculia bacterium]